MLTIVLVRFHIERGLDTCSHRIFYKMLLTSVSCVLLDIFSIVCIYLVVYKDYAAWLAIVSCKLYLISLLTNGYLSFKYVASDCLLLRDRRRVLAVYLCLILVSDISIILSTLHYTMVGRVVYTYGVATTIAYVTIYILFASTVILAVRSNSQISTHKMCVIILWQLAWVVTSIIQFLKTDLLIVSFGLSLGVFLIYFELENPHVGLDHLTGQHTYNAFNRYVFDKFRNNIHFSTLYIKVDYMGNSFDHDFARSVMISLSKFLAYIKSKNAFIFCKPNDTIFVTFDNYTDLISLMSNLRFHSNNLLGDYVKLYYFVIPDNTSFINADEFFNGIYYFDSSKPSKQVTILNEDNLKEINRYFYLKATIEDALAQDNIEVYYQPFYEVRAHKFTMAEALVRIRDINGDLVPPSLFIPVAEHSGLIKPLGQEIFKKVCKLLSTNTVQQLGIKCIEVNLSPSQFDKLDPYNFVQSILVAYGIDSNLINLEITETPTTVEKQLILDNIKALHNFGIHFALDDFGTGSSNLDYFIEMPVSVIKFDYQFTQSYFNNFKTKYLMECIIELMHKLNLVIVAEGVETKEQYKAMCELGIEYIQGYFFSRPLSEDNFIKFLKYNNQSNIQEVF